MSSLSTVVFQQAPKRCELLAVLSTKALLSQEDKDERWPAEFAKLARVLNDVRTSPILIVKMLFR